MTDDKLRIEQLAPIYIICKDRFVSAKLTKYLHNCKFSLK